MPPMRTLLAACSVSLLLAAGAAGTARAGGSAGTIGVGAEVQLNGSVGGVSVDYDGGQFHAGGVLGFADNTDGFEDTDLRVGGRFFYHLHSSTLADFGVGGELGLRTFDAGAADFTGFYLDAGFQIRSFISTNVALSFSGGVAIGTADADGVSLGGNLLGGAGVHYYFF
jgi:hypothetical protein